MQAAARWISQSCRVRESGKGASPLPTAVARPLPAPQVRERLCSIMIHVSDLNASLPWYTGGQMGGWVAAAIGDDLVASAAVCCGGRLAVGGLRDHGGLWDHPASQGVVRESSHEAGRRTDRSPACLPGAQACWACWCTSGTRAGRRVGTCPPGWRLTCTNLKSGGFAAPAPS